jgi:hypothetical protein
MKCGDTVRFYLAAERNGASGDNDDTFNVNNSDPSVLDYALWPMYYQQPQEVLGSNAQYYEYTLNQTHD